MEKILQKAKQRKSEGKDPLRLFLHSCCAPCSSYCLEVLSEYFNVTVYYYDPNIYPDEEYHKRAREQERFVTLIPTKNPVSFLEGPFEKNVFYETVKGLEDEPERGARCARCWDPPLHITSQSAVRV